MSKKEEATLTPFDPSQGRKSKKVPVTEVARKVSRRIGKREPNTEFDYQAVLKFAWVPVEQVYINYDRQRWPEPTHIKKLSAKWNIVCVTPLQCRYDPNEDRFYGADGQQHTIEWVRQYGDQSLVPVFYIESTDENIESIQLLALNNDNEPMAKFFIHQQKCKMGDEKSIALEQTVQSADCATAYKKRFPGAITHISDLEMAHKEFGLDSLFTVLSKYRQYWPTEVIKTATMLGFLKVKSILEKAGIFDDDVYEEIFASCTEYFLNSDRLHLDIKDEFVVAYPTNYKGMGAREKVASGIIDVYERKTGNMLVYSKDIHEVNKKGERVLVAAKGTSIKPFEITMPMMEEHNETI